MAETSLPLVSVIVPVYNAEKQVSQTLTALFRQDIDSALYEVIVVDNGSTDRTVEILESFEELRVITNEQTKNPYISRNMGVEQAGGDIIAFLDVTCSPDENWLRSGIERIEGGADLVGGKIEYTYSDSPTLGEWLDSITFVNVKTYIERFGSAAGGNLFVKKEVWDALGPFPESGRSGMDSYWTRKATKAGFRLEYGEKAVVYYPARDLVGVLKKSYRVGKGHAEAWQKEGRPRGSSWWEILKTYSPPAVGEVEQRINERGTQEMLGKLYRLWMLSWLNKMVMGWGRTVAMVQGNSGSGVGDGQ